MGLVFVLNMFQDKRNRDCNHDYFQFNRNRTVIDCIVILVIRDHLIEQVAHNRNRLHLWCNRPMSASN